MRSTPLPPELLVRFETAGGQRTLLYPCEFSVLVSPKVDVGQTEREVVSLWTRSPVCFLAISNLRQDLSRPFC